MLLVQGCKRPCWVLVQTQQDPAEQQGPVKQQLQGV
jgi:hypothetical protein